MQKKGKEYKNLREIDRSHTAGVVAAKTGLFALSIVGALSGVYIPDVSGGGFSKEELMGTEISDVKDISRLTTPVDEIVQIISNDIGNKMKKNPILSSIKYEYPLIVRSEGNT